MQISQLRFVLLHYHILKNAGTTIEGMLDRSFGKSFCTVDHNERDAHFPNDALVRLIKQNSLVRALSSHQIHYPVPQEPGFIFFDLCFLRDPIDRLRSIYDYFREKPADGDAVSAYANELELGDFIARLIKEMPWYMNDVQVNLLANGVVNDCPSKADLERATLRLMRISFPGVVDCFSESLVAGQYFLHPIFPELDCLAPALNVSTKAEKAIGERLVRVRDACSKKVFGELMDLNAMDLELLERARQEIRRRCSLVPAGKSQELSERVRSSSLPQTAPKPAMVG